MKGLISLYKPTETIPSCLGSNTVPQYHYWSQQLYSSAVNWKPVAITKQ